MKIAIRFKPAVQQVLRMFVVIPRVLRFFNPNKTYCEKCGLPWNWCKSKTVKYSEHSGTFATCDVCWNNSTLTELKQYYTNVYRMQVRTAVEYHLFYYGTDYKIDHTLEHLLQCVEAEYLRTHVV